MKINSHSFSAALAIAATALAGSPVTAQAIGPAALYTVILPAGEFGSQSYTDVLTGNIAAAQKFCAELGNDSYTVDCLSERLEKIADDIPKDSDYAEVKTILKDTSDQLAELARANRDPAQARGRATRAGADPVTTTRPLTPIRPEAVPQANAQAQAILDSTQTLLLRSAEGSESKSLQYSRIADALGSTKVLLRSA